MSSIHVQFNGYHNALKIDSFSNRTSQSGTIRRMTTLLSFLRLQKRKIACAGIIALAGLSTTSFAYKAQDIPSYTLRYTVEFRGSSIGELEISIKTSGDDVIVRGETFPNALANLFGDGKVIETIKYTEYGDKLVLTTLTEKKGQSNPQTKQLHVDHQKNTLLAHKNIIKISPEDQIDAYTFPLLSILGLTDSSSGSEEKLVTAEKVREYRYHPPTHETITTDAGTFKTLKKSKTRVNKPKTIALWLTESAPIMPVQIQIDRDGKREVSIRLIQAQ